MFRYVRPLVRYAGVVLLLVLLGGAAGLGYSLRQHKVYTTTATLLLNPSAPAPAIPYLKNLLTDTSGIPPINILADTYGQYLQSQDFDARVVQKLGLNISSSRLGASISSWLTPNTSYFNIGVDWDSPNEAAAIANGVAQTFVDVNNGSQAHPATTADQAIATALSKRIDALKTKLARLLGTPNADQGHVDSLENQVISLQDTYDRLLPSGGAAGTTQTASLSGLAAIPSAPIMPHTKQNTLAGLLAGLLMGLVLVYVLESLDRTVRSSQDLEEVTGAAPLGIIGHIAPGRNDRMPRMASGPANGHDGGTSPGIRSLANLDMRDPRLVMLTQPASVASESFRALRTNLEFVGPDGALKSVVVTGWQRGQGSSTVATNLAIALAHIGKRVILVDADLHQPSLASLFSVESSYGLANILNNEISDLLIDRVVYSTAVQNLRVVPAGFLVSHQAELIASNVMVDFLRALEQQADLVILDTPPLSAAADAVALAVHTSGSVVVARAGSIQREIVLHSMSRLQRVGARVLGIVLNDVEARAMAESTRQGVEPRLHNLDMRSQEFSGPRSGSGIVSR